MLDPNDLLHAFKHVRMKEGYVLDYVWRGSHHAGAPLLYARRHDEPSLRSSAEYRARYLPTGTEPHLTRNDEDAYLPYVEFDPEPLGYSEFLVFRNEINFFYWVWHAFYERSEYLPTQRAREANLNQDGTHLSHEDQERVRSAFLGARVREKNGSAWVGMLRYHPFRWGIQSLHVAAPNKILGGDYELVAEAAGWTRMY